MFFFLSQSLDDNKEFFAAFKAYVVRYVVALGSILPVFTYLNRFYIEPKLETDLKVILTKLFVDVLDVPVVQRVIRK